jgi:hypothetical protein
MSINVGSIVHDALADAFGTESVTLTHRGTAATLTARVAEEADELVDVSGVQVVRRVLTLAIKIQTGFAVVSGEAEPVEPGDTIVRNSRTHVVAAPITKSVDGQVYRVRCVQEKHMGHGLKGGA